MEWLKGYWERVFTNDLNGQLPLEGNGHRFGAKERPSLSNEVCFY